jgi:hypothetical protein
MKKFLFSLLIYFLYSFSAFSASYYWVGGDGNWNDINHWRTTSGGSVLPQVVPSSNDDVYFDDNSGFTLPNPRITINANATCRNITFTGTGPAPAIYSSSSSRALNIYGNSVFKAGMIIRADVYFQNTGSPKTIRSNGAVFGDTQTIPNIYLNEATSITLLDDFEAGNRTSIYLQAGTFNTNNNKISAYQFFANGTGNKTLNLGSSEVVVWGEYNSNNRGVFNTNSSTTILNAGTSHIRFMGSATISNGLVGYAGQTFYNVTYEDATSSGASMSGGLNFNRVEFKGNAYIQGDNTFNELILASGKEHILSASRTQTINKQFTAGKSCEYATIIRSNTLIAKVSVSAGAQVDLNGLFVQNVTATGIPLVANNSTGLGTTTGWSFTDASVAKLYWVGGAGDWGDASHWSLTSGGAGGACTPGTGTDVFFDAKSGFTSTSNTVTINGGANCKDIVFNGSAIPPKVIASGQSTLNVYGSSAWQSGMTMDIYKIIYQNTGVAKTIKSNGVATGKLSEGSLVESYVEINETASISLLDDFIGGGNLTINAGTFNTNSHKVTMYGIWGNTGSALNLGASDIYFVTSRSYFSLIAGRPVLNAGTSHLHFTANMTTARGINVTGGGTVSFYNVSFENPASTTGKIDGGGASSILTFNKITATGGLILGKADITTEELNLGSGKNYVFPAGRTVTVNKKMTIGAPCAAWTNLNTETAGTQSTLSMPAAASLDVQRVFLQDIKATGKTTFTASDSKDNGNNSANWSFVTSPPKNLYWVGGAGNWDDATHWSFTSGGTGGACIPGLTDNVFFDAGSGFTTTSTTVEITGAAYCRNITVSGSATPPIITSSENTANSLNIYGSSVWQSGMTMSVNVINYQNTGEVKTITSNGVFTGRSAISSSGLYPTWVNIYETRSISLADDFKATNLAVYAGTFNTNNHKITLNSDFSAADNTSSKTLNLGSSEIELIGGWSIFDVSSPTVVLNAGTSHIQFTNGFDYVSLKGYAGQVFNNVTMGKDESYSNYLITSTGTGLIFNTVTFFGGGRIEGNNIFNELKLFSTVRYLFEENKTQTIKTNLVMGGTPCAVVEILSTGNTAGIRANLNVQAGNTEFNFIDLKSMNASGLSLHFGSKSTVANQNNNNVTFDPYDAGELEGLGADWICHTFNDSDSTTYTLSAHGFFGNEFTKYAWTKIGDPNHTGVIGTNETLDVRPFGYGTYKVEVTYYNGSVMTCKVSDDILIQKTPPIEVDSPFEVCIKGSSTKISDVVGINGKNIKWYATSTSTTALPASTVLVNGATYYITQTIDGCESARTPITIKLVQCSKAVYMNPGLRLRVKSNN